MTASKIAYYGVGLKIDCPAVNSKYVSIITGIGSPNLTYQVVTTGDDVHPPLPWPPDPDSEYYSERCTCGECAGRLVGDTVAAITAELNGIQGDMKVNQDTYQLRYLESARDVVFRKAQLGGYGFVRGFDHHRNVAPSTETYFLGSLRVSVRYDNGFQEVEEVSAWAPAATQQPGSYPGTLAGALAALG